MSSRISLKMLVLSAAVAAPLCAQLKFSEHSQLANPDYLEHKIKRINDEELFDALQLDTPALQRIGEPRRRKDFVQAYRAWGTYWEAKEQPRYSSQTDHLLIDTDMLEGYDQIRAYGAHHPEERDTINARASLLLKNTLRPWGDVTVDFGGSVDFNREIGQSGKYGFHYWIWSKPLILAFLMSGDQKYLAKFDELFQQWYVQRNSITRGFPELDVVYYELGLGIRNRMFIEYYLLPYKQ